MPTAIFAYFFIIFSIKIFANFTCKKNIKKIEIMKNVKNKYIIKLKDNFYDKLNEGYCIVMEIRLISIK